MENKKKMSLLLFKSDTVSSDSPLRNRNTIATLTTPLITHL